MKILKIISVFLISCFLPAMGHAETIYFLLSNLDIHSQSRTPIYDSSGNPLAGSGYLAQLYVGKDQNSLQPLLPTAPFLTGPLAGFVSKTIDVNNIQQYGIYACQIRAWDASLGSTYADAAAQGRGGVGESNIASEMPGLPGFEPGPIMGLQTFSLSPLIVPEPSTYALLGVGVVALGWQRRRSGRTCSGPASQ